jgi:GNAT superfamily N-acetyltransferase
MVRVVFVDPDGDEDGLADAAWDLASRSDVNVLSDKDLLAVALDDGELVGAVFDSLVADSYSFDVVVDPDHMGRGVGRKLIDAAMSNFDTLKETGAKLVLDVVNRALIPTFERRGLKVQSEEGDHVIMTASKGPFSLQPGPAFVLNDSGTWDVKPVPRDVLEGAAYSGHLVIEGYRCVVFDAPDGSTWAQKAQERISSMLLRIAARLAC